MTPIPADKEAQEDAVLLSLVEQMRRSGLHAELVENPDRLTEGSRRFPDVTCDGLISVERAELWAVDVMTLAGPIALVQTMEMMDQRLERVAVERGAHLSFSGYLPEASSVDETVASVSSAMANQPDGECEPSPGLHVAWSPASTPDDVGVFGVAGLNQSALLSEQIEAAIAGPLVKKATRQSQAGKLAGCRTAVLLDQVGHAGIKQGTQWLPQHPHTFKTAVTNVLSVVPQHHLDAVLLHDSQGGWHSLVGAVPGV